jgi:hypothetical protein
MALLWTMLISLVGAPTFGQAADPGADTAVAMCDVEKSAWRQLAEGDPEVALWSFADLIDAHPGEGRAVVGYALAAAGMGDLAGGAAAMVFALRTDPTALREITVEPPLQRRLRRLALHYYDQVTHYALDADAMLMLSAIYLLVDDRAGARSALELCEDARGRTRALVALKRLIEDEPEPGTEVDPPPGTSAPSEPTEPADYNRLSRELLEISNLLDRFTNKLFEKMSTGTGSPSAASASMR